MPCFNKEEILVIGEYLRNNNQIPREMNESYYTKESIEERFDQFGGVIRHVFPYRPSQIEERKRKQTYTEMFSNSSETINNQTLQNQEDFLDYIQKYEVPRKSIGNETRFRRPGINVVSSNISNTLKSRLHYIKTNDIIQSLLKNDDSPSHMKDICDELYQTILIRKIISTNGLSCVQKQFKLNTINQNNENNENNGEWIEYKCKLNGKETNDREDKKIIPVYNNMIPNTLYNPTNKHNKFPFCKFYYKDENGNIVIFLVSKNQLSSSKYISQSSFSQVMNMIKFPKRNFETKIKLILIPGPNEVETISLKIRVDDENNSKDYDLNSIKTYTILKFDRNYEELKDEENKNEK